METHATKDSNGPGHTPRLKPNSMTWLGAGLMGAVIMSPAGGIYFNFTPMETTAGRVVPLIVLMAMIVILPTALSYAAMSRSLPSVGNAYTWMRHAINPTAGIYTGWVQSGFYLLAQIVLPGIAALFFDQILNDMGIPTSYWTWALGVLILTALVVLFNYRGIELSVRSTMIFMAIEAVVVFALMITIFIVQAGRGQFTAHDAVAAFTPGGATGGTLAVFGALVFGIQGNVGFDAVSTMAEETRSPKKYIPIATMVAVVGVGVYWIITGLGFVAGLPVADVVKIANSGGSPVTAMALQYWGEAGQVVIAILAFTSILAIYVSQNVASSRALYAMGREGTAPRWLGRISPTARVPRNAMTAGLVATVVVTLLLGALLGESNQFNWTATMSSALALLTYLSVNIANFMYHFRQKRSEFRFFMHGVVPVVGVIVILYVIYSSYLGSLFSAGWTYGVSIQLAIVIWLVLGVAWTVWLRMKRPEVFSASTDVVPPEGVDAPVLAAGQVELQDKSTL